MSWSWSFMSSCLTELFNLDHDLDDIIFIDICRVLTLHTKYLCFIPLLLSAGGSHCVVVWCLSLQLWEADSGRCVATLTGHSEEVLDVCFNLSGHLVATASADGETLFLTWLSLTLFTPTYEDGRDLSDLYHVITCVRCSCDQQTARF